MSVFAGLTPPYATIVADPPWHYDERVVSYGEGRSLPAQPMPYSTMSNEDIAALLAVAEEARNVLAAHDEAAESDAEMDWTGPMVDLRLRAALAALDPTTERGA